MSLKENNSKPAEALHQEIQQASSRTSARAGLLNSYIPYLIAASFVAMTALLTLLLTMVMDNKAELDEVIADRQQFPEPILADARMAFGQGMGTGMQSDSTDSPSSALLSEESAIAPEALPTAITSETETQAVLATEELASPAGQLATDTGSQTQTDAPVAPAAVALQPSPLNLTGNEPNSIVPAAEQALAVSTIEFGNRQLEKIVSTHEAQIQSFHRMLQHQTANHEEMQDAITHQMQVMEKQIQAIEQIMRPVMPSAVVGYDRMINRRRESHHRMMQRRDRMLQRALDSRHRLHEDYTSLLNLLELGEENVRLARQ